MLHMYTDVHIGKENKTVTLNVKLGWILFGGNKNKTFNVNAFSKECNLDEMVFKVLRNWIRWCV